MATLAPYETINVAFPQDITAFLNRRAERERLSIPQTLTVILAGIMANHEDEANDPFYSESNMRVLRESIAQAERGEFAKTMTFEELEAVTNEAMAKLK